MNTIVPPEEMNGMNMRSRRFAVIGSGASGCYAVEALLRGDPELRVDVIERLPTPFGLIRYGVAPDHQGTKAVIVEVNAETDFVARNESFQEFVRKVAEIGLSQGGDLAKSAGAAFPGTGRNVQDELAHRIATIGENMSLRRMAQVSVSRT